MKNRFWASARGFSLMEILVALTLLGLAGTFVVSKVYDSMVTGQVQSCEIQLQSLADRLKEFRMHCGFFPTSQQGLDALINKPSGERECKRYAPGGYLDPAEVPQDPWGAEFIYESDGKTITMRSNGPDGIEGNEDDLTYPPSKKSGSAEEPTE
ncbi:MAG: type II secretion system protein GspG [Bdellovibrionales bacterium RIFOXYD12_FULL_39_22]|nr:MAG: type II secretion system protein GspG [Bdellovibrionales bacterium RIFOXYB1_FULL_39_21]OFZ41278.1 MAG: type II secretion system protein GspG [Bdellovibrionales bacterium RIFOXYC12_FULL_39_17]OFZ45072.1 MAG: type II secretion system protein GspG [Bdellovibrionales bacterium RIFOXYC1_FULL_39_130]OFZ74456.1 MAG: type II secretion system protein GspG [Bdellovibrionales bacterium RIFOXYD1_FULL_39_84]OFZ92468.1 MAG: type II secretion system protein GspG [Bdellovibrionales bacterium RIFOXYD12_